MHTSVFFKEARATQARESRKSPANTANCNQQTKANNKKLGLQSSVFLSFKMLTEEPLMDQTCKSE